MGQTLVRGQRSKLADLGLGLAFELHLSVRGVRRPVLLAVVVDEGDQAISPAHAVLNQPGSSPTPCGSLTATTGPEGWSTAFNLDRLPAGASGVLVGLAFDDRSGADLETAAQIEHGQLELRQGGQVAASYTFSADDFSRERSLLLGQVYRKDGVWRFAVSGTGFYAGVSALFGHVGLPLGLLPVPGGRPGLAPAERPVMDNAGGAMAPSEPAQIEAQVRLPAAWPGGSAPRIPAGLTGALAFIVVEQPDGSAASGTGFFVTPGGHLLTCRHVTQDGVRVLVRAEGSEDLREARVLVSDEHHDLALLWVSDGAGSAHWLPLDLESDPQLGDELGLLAYPLGTTLGEGVTYSQGIVNGLRKQNGTPFLQIDTGAAPGSSGGPIFRRDSGRVIGLLHGGLNVGERGMIINLGIDIRNLGALGWLK